jgi:hypothetical protein
MSPELPRNLKLGQVRRTAGIVTRSEWNQLSHDEQAAVDALSWQIVWRCRQKRHPALEGDDCIFLTVRHVQRLLRAIGAAKTGEKAAAAAISTMQAKGWIEDTGRTKKPRRGEQSVEGGKDSQPDLQHGEMRKIRPRRPKPAVIAQGTELRAGREFELLVLEPATRDYLLDVDGLKHFPPPKGWRWPEIPSRMSAKSLDAWRRAHKDLVLLREGERMVARVRLRRDICGEGTAPRPSRKGASAAVPLIVVLAVLSLVRAAPADTGVLDQYQTQVDTGGAPSVSEGQSLAQTFTAGLTGGLDKLDLALGKDVLPGILEVEVRATSGGTPTSTILGSTQVDPSGVQPFPQFPPPFFSVPISPAIPVTRARSAITSGTSVP